VSVKTNIICDECLESQHIESSTVCIKCYNKTIDENEMLKKQLDGSIKEINRIMDVKDLHTSQDIRDLACIAEAFHNITRCPLCHRPTQDTYKCIFCENPDEEPLTIELEYTEEE